MQKEKQLFLNEVKERIEKSWGFIVVNYEKLLPQLSWELSSRLNEKSSYFEVTKKRIFVKAAESIGLSFALKDLRGHIGIVFLEKEEPIEVIKVVYDFSKEKADLFKVIIGCFEGKTCGLQDITVLSKLTSEKEMKGQFIALLVSSISQTLAVMDNLLLTFVCCLESKVKKNKSEVNCG